MKKAMIKSIISLLCVLTMSCYANAADGYGTLTIGNRTYDMARDASASTWEYQSDWKDLYLYDGFEGAIRATDDLYLHICGNCTIYDLTVSDGGSYLWAGITMECGSSARILGTQGHDAIYVDGTLSIYDNGSSGSSPSTYDYTLEILGGNGPTGGDAIEASVCNIFANTGYLRIEGGDASHTDGNGEKVYYSGGVGGRGIFTYETEISIKGYGYLCGGYGKKTSYSAIDYSRYCVIDPSDMALLGGSTTKAPITRGSGANAYVLNDCVETRTEVYRYDYQPAEFSVTFRGNGGQLLTGASSTTLRLRGNESFLPSDYVTFYNLSSPDAILLGYVDEAYGIFYYPSEHVTVRESMTLRAIWAQPNEAVIVSDDLKNGSYAYAFGAGEQVTLPSAALLNDAERYAGFASNFTNYGTINLYDFASVADIRPGSVLCPVELRGYDGINVLYHGNGGATELGNNAVLRYNWDTMTCEDNTFAFRRDGYRFTGWNTAPDGKGIAVKVGQSLPYSPTDGVCCYNLYAQWQPLFREYGDAVKLLRKDTDLFEAQCANARATSAAVAFYDEQMQFMKSQLVPLSGSDRFAFRCPDAPFGQAKLFLTDCYAPVAEAIALDGMDKLPLPPADSREVIRVSTTDELFDAIGSDRIIELAPGTYNVTDWIERHLDDMTALSRAEADEVPSARRYEDNPCIWVGDSFDGYGLYINDLAGLTLRSAGDAAQVSVVSEPRYAEVITFRDMTDITVEDITFGHTEGGYCMGAVLGFSWCDRVVLNGLDLYGCGTYGMELYCTDRVRVNGGCIHDCSYGCLAGMRSTDILFEDVTFRNCPSYFDGSLFRGDWWAHSGDMKLSFVGCTFENIANEFAGIIGCTGCCDFVDCTFDEQSLSVLRALYGYGSTYREWHTR